MKQIKFCDLDDNSTHGGIMLDNGDVICGCCGGIFERDEEGETWEFVKELEWVNLDEAILGDG